MWPTLLNALAIGLFLPLLVDALKRAFDGTNASADRDPQGLGIWLALALFALGASLLSADLARATSLHYSGAAFLALTLGYSRALLTASAITAASAPPALLGVSLVTEAVVPVWLTCALVTASRRLLPPNPFVFLLGCGFFGLFLVGAVQLALGTGVVALLGAEQGTMPLAPSERLIWGLLLAVGEATLEGMLITVLVVYAPRAVATFDDRFYLPPRS